MRIVVDGVSHVYKPGTPFETKALDNINLTIEPGEFIGLIGHTGSGKSTLIQHLNGLLLPTEGNVWVGDLDVLSNKANLVKIRQRVGLVFQYPEHQLFEETVYDDVAFGPRNLQLSPEEVDRRVRKALTTVGLDFEAVKDRSPFALSGGQMRRVAIAGVLAMEPQVLILDEPTAGLDPKGRDEILEQIAAMHRSLGITVILVSHNMEDVARYASRVIVMHRGRVVMDGPPRQVFSRVEELQSLGLGVPLVGILMERLKSLGYDVRTDVLTVEEAGQEILKWWRGRKHA
ncbi:MAG TPA: energy-coupling factor transporter ATPase [Clostridia bacterium]|nr:energy-coupling factor transporter ATPase [Clostridia bacterium]